MDKLSWLPLPTTQSSLSDFVRLTDVSSFDEEWKDLCFAPWRFFYLDYHHLQQDENIEQRLEAEWLKVYEFYMMKKGEIERRACQLEQKEIKTLLQDIHQLYHFSKLNYCGFLRLFMQQQRLFGSAPSLRRLMINKPFWDNSCDLFSLAVCFNQTCIQHPIIDSSSSSTTTLRSAETAHERSIKKYWVHPDHIVELMLFLSTNNMVIQDYQNNPSSTFTATDEIGHPHNIKSESTDIHHQENKLQKKLFSGRVKVSTVYMDSPDLNDYTEKLVGQTDTLSCTKTTRIRSYDNVPCSSIEQKIYYNQQQIRHKGVGKEPQHQCCGTPTALSWVQQRVWFKHKHMQALLNGNYSISSLLSKPACQYRTDGLLTEKDIQRMKQTCLKLQDEIHNKIKLPILNATQYRTVYASEKVTVTIDTDITMTRPKHEDLLRFPYCVVQIEQTKPQAWLAKLEASPILEPVHDFSLYLHGVASLHKVDVYPNWLLKLSSLDIRHTNCRGNLLSKEHVTSWSSDTIATIVTCFDEEEVKPSLSSSSSSSSLLSPLPRQQGQLRRSFDSYCSFDHPTSSRSDPTNCKSCMGKVNDSQRLYVFRKKRPDIAEITFFSVVKNAIWPYSVEKEPLLPRYKQESTTGHYLMGFSRPTVITAACVFTSFIISYLLYIFIMKIK